MKQKDPTKTPSTWKKECLRLLRLVDPAYEVNRQVSGRFIEFVRPLPGGLWFSQNFICIRDTYHLCAALLFSLKPTTRLYHPLFAGSRFDHNRTIWRQMIDDLGLKRGDAGYPVGVWSSGVWYSNTLENVAKGFATNEQVLLPHYSGVLHRGRHRLAAFFQAAVSIVPRIDAARPVIEQTEQFGFSTQDVTSFPLGAATLHAGTVAMGGGCWKGFGPRAEVVDLDSVPSELLVLHYADVLLPEAERLPEYLEWAKQI